MNEIINFAVYLTDLKKETVVDAYNDWLLLRQKKVEKINDITDP